MFVRNVLFYSLFAYWGQVCAQETDTLGRNSVLSPNKMNRGLQVSPVGLLQNRLPGIWSWATGSEPTRQYDVYMRGIGSFEGARQPLFVVDGVPGVDPALIAPADVAQIQVLTDPASMALYGARGANGVICLNTKRQAISDSLDTRQAWQLVLQTDVASQQRNRWIDMLQATDYRAGLSSTQQRFDLGGATDWQKAISRTAFQQNYYLRAIGKVKTIRLSGAINYLDAPGVIRHNQLSRFNARFLAANRPDRPFFWQASLFTRNERQLPLDATALIYALNALPTASVYQADGSFTPFTGFDSGNAVARLAQVEQTDHIANWQAQLFGRYRFTDRWQLDTRFSVNKQRARFDYDERPFTGQNAVAYQLDDDLYQQFWETTLRYRSAIPADRPTIQAALSTAWQQWRYAGAVRQPGIVEQTNGSDYALWSVTAWGEWAAANRRLHLRATARVDQSTRFGERYRVVMNPAASADYALIAPSNSASRKLCLRVGYGLLANQASLLQPTPVMSEAQLRPERQRLLTVSLVGALLASRLQSTLTFFDRKTTRTYWLDASDGLGLDNQLTNRGQLVNRGIEWQLTGKLIRRSRLQWDITLNATYLQNRVTTLDSPNFRIVNAPVSGRGLSGQNTQLIQAGYSLFTFYALGFAGIDGQGKYQYQDLNWDGIISYENDRKTVGSALPRYQIGATTRLSSGRWQLEGLLDGLLGFNILNATQLNVGNLIRYPINNVSRLGWAQGLNDYANFTSQWIQSGSFLRLNYATLSYALPLPKHTLVLSLTTQNQLLWTRYQGPDPEAALAAQPLGHDNRTIVPNARTISVGLRLTL